VNTPWGKSDSKVTYRFGVSFVTTPSHGGFMVSPSAQSLLSEAARKRGKQYGSYLAFEEDCDAYIILLEIMHSGEAMPDVLKYLVNIPTRERVLEGLSSWHADYLLERGIQPTAEGLKFFNENRLHDRMRADKSPDLIVSASGSWAQWVPEGCVGVTTADGSRWLVRSDEYEKRNTNLTLLSHFKLVKAVS
jgi:hypothetical protein